RRLVGVLDVGHRQATGRGGDGEEEGDGRRHRDQRHRPPGPAAGAPVGQVELAPHRGADTVELRQRLAARVATGDVLRHTFDQLPVEVGAQLEGRRMAAADHRCSWTRPSVATPWAMWRATRLRAAWRRDITVPMLTDCTSEISA